MRFGLILFFLIAAIVLSGCPQPDGNGADTNTDNNIFDVNFDDLDADYNALIETCNSTCVARLYEHWALKLDSDGKLFCFCTKEVCRVIGETNTTITKSCDTIADSFYFE